MSLFYGREIENPREAIIDYIKKSDRVGIDDLDNLDDDDDEYLEETFKTAVAIVLGLQITPVQLIELPIKLITRKGLYCRDYLGFSNPSKYYVVCNIIDSKSKKDSNMNTGRVIAISSPFMNIMPLSVVRYEQFKNICNELKLIFSTAPNDKSPHLVSCDMD